MRRELVILLILCGVFLAIGCAGTEQQPNETGTPVEEVSEVQEPVEPAREDVAPGATPVLPSQGEIPGVSNESQAFDVSIVNSSFNPETVTILTGETVSWTNHDTLTHTVTGKGASFGSKALAPGDSYEFLFTDPGAYDYYCSIHPSMKGTVIVEKG